MSRAKSHHNARRPQLPFTMRQELGISSSKRQRTQISDRKQRRKEDRREKGGYANKRRKIAQDVESEEEEAEVLEDYSSEDEVGQGFQQISHTKTDRRVSEKPPKPSSPPSESFVSSDVSDLELDGIEDEHSEDDSLSRGSREYSPEVVLDANSTTFQDRQAEEDAEILALERKLGMKNKTDMFDDDGLDNLLGDLKSATAPRTQDQEAKEWLKQKRRKAAAGRGMDATSQSGEDGTADSYDDAFDGFDDGSGASEMSASEDTLEDEDDDEDGEEEARAAIKTTAKPKRENPYVAPVTNNSIVKYVPPSRRQTPTGDVEVLQKLRKQAQGSLNKLSEANIISIVDEFSKFYQQYPRQEVTNITVELLLTIFAIPTALNNTFIILHAAFTASLYKINGADFGAEMISRLVETFDKYHGSTGKESLNLTSLLANLFTFNVISSTLVYDHIRLLLTHFGSSTSNSEEGAEQLLRIIRDCGPQLRSDDPTALKGIVAMMSQTATKMTADGNKINIRTRVMMDTITDLKNNKIRHNTSAAGVTGEHLTRMRKAMGSLSNRQLRGTEPLNISRADIMNSDKKGKWWLVGASWKGHSQPQHSANSTTDRDQRPTETHSANGKVSLKTTDTSTDAIESSSEIDIRTLAASHNLTTPIRLAIFTALITAHSPPDALHRLSKLRLTRRQEPEVPRVLLTLCRAEPNFNPYYAALAHQLLRDRKYKMMFSIALWKFFGDLGEKADLEEDDGANDATAYERPDGNIPVTELANVARLYARLISKRSISLSILKTLNIGPLLGEKASLWLEVFFIAIFSQNKLDDEALVHIFGTGIDGTDDGRLANGIMWFLRRKVKGSDLLTGGKEERSRVRSAVKVVEAAFAAMQGEGDDFGDEN